LVPDSIIIYRYSNIQFISP